MMQTRLRLARWWYLQCLKAALVLQRTSHRLARYAIGGRLSIAAGLGVTDTAMVQYHAPGAPTVTEDCSIGPEMMASMLASGMRRGRPMPKA